MELLKQKEGGNRMNHYEAINDVLVNLFNEILDLEERALITGEYKNISVNDMHIINAVGIREQKNMSTVARELNVTVGTLTIAVNNLVKNQAVSANADTAFHPQAVFHLLSRPGHHGS